MRIGRWIAKNRVLILIIGALLIVPSVIGFAGTRVNYDLLSYLPDSLETVNGQNIMVDEYGTGAFAMIVTEGMPLKDVEKAEEKVSEIPHVKKVLWYGSLVDISIPSEFLPEKIRTALFNGDATLMIAFLDDTTSSDASMEAVRQMRKVLSAQCFVSGMTGIVTDIADLCMQELPVYVVIAAILSLIVLLITTDSFLVPFFFLLSIGLSILYNLGSNIFLGQISYVTQALSAVLQLAVTMDYSIFLLESFEECKQEHPDDTNMAMGIAIARTFLSVISSSVTTVAGFMALCVMTFALGRDIGIVMSKGVLIGVLCCVTILPAMILVFDKAIEKTRHKPLIPSPDKVSEWITGHSFIWLILFAVMLVPSLYGSQNTKIYYNIAQSLPDSILSNQANEKLEDDFHLNCLHIVMMDRNTDVAEKREMLNEISDVEGVKWALGIPSVLGPMVPEHIVPEKIRDILQSDQHELAFICSEYKSATDEVNRQIAEIDEIVKKHDPSASVIGEAPMMKDLQDTTDVDLQRVNFISIAAIFLIILVTFRSLSLPFILVAVIEFAINVNMAIPYYQNISLPFVASIVIGTIQLGATVDYAILMTNRYVTERQSGKSRNEAISIAHKSSFLSIITSGCSFFVATFGVSVYSKVDMIGSICTLLSRGALISMAAVLLLLPALFRLLDGVIIRTGKGFKTK